VHPLQARVAFAFHIRLRHKSHSGVKAVAFSAEQHHNFVQQVDVAVFKLKIRLWVLQIENKTSMSTYSLVPEFDSL